MSYQSTTRFMSLTERQLLSNFHPSMMPLMWPGSCDTYENTRGKITLILLFSFIYLEFLHAY